jgi:cytochrome c biogenesis protein CcdA/HEAT repeat protein
MLCVLAGFAGGAGAVPKAPAPGPAATLPTAPEPEAKPSPERCRELALLLGDPATRATAQKELAESGPLVPRPWIDLLSDPDLAVRLGAIEVLEDHAGSDLGYDPWEDDPNQRHEASQGWEEWLASGGTSAVGFRLGAPLREESVRVYLADILSGDAAKTERAIGRLATQPRDAIGRIEAHLSEMGDAAPGARARLKEAQYRLLLDSASVPEGRRIARLIAAGNRDERIEGLGLLTSAPTSVLPVVGDGLRDAEPLVRERAMDLLLALGGAGAIPAATEHLAKDDDPNVAYAAIRALGKIEGAASVRALLPRLESADEDEVAAALQSLALLGEAARAVAKQVEPLLEHPSWRVRAAVLQYVSKTRAVLSEAALLERLEDEDSFVRSVAVAAVALSQSESGGRGGNFPEKIEKAFAAAVAKYPDLQGPVFRACGSADKAIPEELLDRLDQAPVEIRLQALQALDPGNRREVALLLEAANDPRPDLSGAALATLAAAPNASKEVTQILVAALLGNDPNQRENVLNHLDWESSSRAPGKAAWLAAVQALGGGSPAAPATPETRAPDRLDGLFTAFGLAGAPQSPIPNPQSVAPDRIDELLNAFGANPESEASGPAQIANPQSAIPKPQSPISDLAHALEENARSAPLGAEGRASRAALQAARLLVSGGDPRVIDLLVEALPRLSVQDRADLAMDLGTKPHPGFLPLWRLLLADASAEVKARAFRSALDEDFPVLVRFALDECLAPDRVAGLPELYSSSLHYLINDDKTKGAFGELAGTLLESREESRFRIFALILLRSLDASSQLEQIEAELDSEDLWVRRAAIMAVAARSPKSLEGRIADFAADDSVWVREAAAAAPAKTLRVWKHRFSEADEVDDYFRESSPDGFDPFGGTGSLFGRKAKAAAGPPVETLAALRRLTGDVSERVRLAAWMSLLDLREEVDVEAIASLLADSPEREEWGKCLADFFEARAAEVGSALRPLLRFADRKRIEKRALATLESRLGGGKSEGVALDFAAYRQAAPEPEASTPAPQFVAAEPTEGDAPATSPDAAGAVRLVFFHNPGCPECEDVRRDLESMKRRYPGLVVTEHNIRETASVLLNEALCSRFGVDPALRQVTPAVFLQEGALVKSEIDRNAIAALVERTLAVGETKLWADAAETELAEAKEEVESRFAAFGLVGIFLAGLLDGINPCAFATMIFLLSYLQVAKRSSAEILAVGGAYIAAVFLTYFVLGLGLVEVVGRLESLKTAGRVLNLLLAVACLWIAFLSFRDAARARAGRLSEMSLQLPTFLKDRIRGTIRTGARSRRFIAAAFASGVVVSLLELACTGQVYLPTIVFAMKSGETSAYGFLLLYNVAFVLPLLVVFVLAWRGMGSEALVRFQRERTALVKTALGLLFLALFVALVASGRI